MSYGNLAYNDVIRETQRDIREKKRETREKMAAEKRKKDKRFILKTIFTCMVLFISAVFMISRYIELDGTKKRIEALEKELKSAEAYTSQKTFELEQCVDLTRIEEEATMRLNMQRPEKYQIIYLNMKKEDTTEVTADEVEGVKNNISAKAEELKNNISGIFKFSK
ncbi:MAG: hypothetical protein J1F64_07070 [Oscillospiraceae bacterium]|nr:hypothetical protein [Oscillospiraceae bacterium]